MKNKQKKYIVTGGCGFVGSHITERLIRDGHVVVVVDNLSAGFENYLPKNSNVIFHNVDISNWNELSKCFLDFQEVDTIFHLAACSRIQPSIKNPNITNDTNVTGTMNILEMMKMCKISNIVYSGSSSFYGDGATIPCHETDKGNPQTPYAVTKHMGELYCQTWTKLYGIRSVILRYFNVYGRRTPLNSSYAPVMGLFFKQALFNEPITIVGDGEQRRDMTYVGDVVEANILASSALSGPNWLDVNGEIFNIGTGTNYSILEITQMIKNCLKSSGIETKIIHIPPREGEARETLANISKATNILDWEPMIDLEDGMDDLKNYYLNNIELLRKGIVNF